MNKLVFICIIALGLPGCALVTAENWPDQGSGGLAEYVASDDPQIHSIRARIDALRASGASFYAAADFENAEVLFARVQRELAGGLYIDGDANLARLQTLLASIERRSPSSARAASGVRR
jgi:hypothetical protein